MKSKAKRFARGGTVYSGAGSNVVKEAKEKGGGFKAGGAVAGGGAAPGRLDRKSGGAVRAKKLARGGSAGGSPFSAAAKLSNLPAKGHSDSHDD